MWRAGQPLRLHLGCGETRFEGYVNIDYPSEAHNVMTPRADYSADIVTLQFPDASVDEIRLHHVFEHFDRTMALALLIRWHRWLKPGGLLRIETPDIEASAAVIASPEATFRAKIGAIRHLEGDQAAPWGFHVQQWFPARLKKTLEELGFVDVDVSISQSSHTPPLHNVEARARKGADVGEEAQFAAADRILWDSTVADGERSTWEQWRKQVRERYYVMPGVTRAAPALVAPSTDAALPGASGASRPRSGTIGRIAREVKRLFRRWRLARTDRLMLKWLARRLAEPSSRVPIDQITGFNALARNQWLQQRAARVPPGSRVLDVGAGSCPYRPLFAHCEYRTQDFKAYEGFLTNRDGRYGEEGRYGEIDYVCDIVDIPVADGSFDVVICTEVLEHVPDPAGAVREIGRILRPGGQLLLTAPLGAGLHQEPFHFYGGFTPHWYKHFLPRADLQIVEIQANGYFFKLLGQECARLAWTFDVHARHHGEYGEAVKRLFGEILPRYLYALDDVAEIREFTVGYFVEARKASTTPR